MKSTTNRSPDSRAAECTYGNAFLSRGHRPAGLTGDRRGARDNQRPPENSAVDHLGFHSSLLDIAWPFGFLIADRATGMPAKQTIIIRQIWVKDPDTGVHVLGKNYMADSENVGT